MPLRIAQTANGPGSGPGTANPTGVVATGGAGTVTVSGAASKTLTGVASTSGIGALLASGGNVQASPTGVSSTAAVGTITTIPAANDFENFDGELPGRFDLLVASGNSQRAYGSNWWNDENWDDHTPPSTFHYHDDGRRFRIVDSHALALGNPSGYPLGWRGRLRDVGETDGNGVLAGQTGLLQTQIQNLTNLQVDCQVEFRHWDREIETKWILHDGYANTSHTFAKGTNNEESVMIIQTWVEPNGYLGPRVLSSTEGMLELGGTMWIVHETTGDYWSSNSTKWLFPSVWLDGVSGGVRRIILDKAQIWKDLATLGYMTNTKYVTTEAYGQESYGWNGTPPSDPYTDFLHVDIYAEGEGDIPITRAVTMGDCLSRNVNAGSNTAYYPASRAVSGNFYTSGSYNAYYQSNVGALSGSNVARIGFDISGYTTEQKSNLILVFTGLGSNQGASPSSSYHLPGSFTIDLNTAAGGGALPTSGYGSPIVTVSGRNFTNFADILPDVGATHNWVRFNATANPAGAGLTDLAGHFDLVDSPTNILAIIGTSQSHKAFKPGNTEATNGTGGGMSDNMGNMIKLQTGKFVACLNLATSGQALGDIIGGAFQARVDMLPPGSLLIIEHGTNDALLLGDTKAEFKANLDTAVTYAQAHGLIVMLAHCNRMARSDYATLVPYNDAMDELIADDPTILGPIPMYALDQAEIDRLGIASLYDTGSDEIHKSGLGQAKQRAWVAQYVSEVYFMGTYTKANWTLHNG